MEMIVFWIYPVKCYVLSSVFSPLSDFVSLCLLSFPLPISFSFIYFLFSVIFFLRQGLPKLSRLLWNFLLCLSVCV